MSTRKYASRYEKLKKRKKEEKLIESKKGSMDKFVISNKQNITQNLDENITNEQEIHHKELEDNEIIQLQDKNCKDRIRLGSKTGTNPRSHSPNNEFIECRKES